MPLARGTTSGLRGSGGAGDLRQGNLTSILRYVRDHGSSSRHDIAAGCGLGISTMTDLIGELQARGLVRELDPIRRPAAGRPTRPIALDGEPWCAVGIQLDLDRLRLCAVTIGGREIGEDTIEVAARDSGPAAAELLGPVLAAQLRRLPADRDLLAVEVGVPGYVARDRGLVTRSTGLGWQDFPLAAVIDQVVADADRHPVRVGLSNDTHLAGLHATRVELGLPTDTVILYLGGVRDLGGALIVGGEVFRGAGGAAGDIAHLNIDIGGAPCRCGRRGCLDTVAGLRQLLIRGGLFGEDAAERLVQHDPRTATKTVVDAASGGESRVLEALADAAAALGRVVDDLTGALNPYAVVLGGYLGPLGDYVLPAIEARTDRALNSGMGAPGVFALPVLLPRVAMGGALAARDACLDDPLNLTRVVR